MPFMSRGTTILNWPPIECLKILALNMNIKFSAESRQQGDCEVPQASDVTIDQDNVNVAKEEVSISTRHLQLEINGVEDEPVSMDTIMDPQLESITLQLLGRVDPVIFKEWAARIEEQGALGKLYSFDVVMHYNPDDHDVFEALRDLLMNVSTYCPQLERLTLRLEAGLLVYMTAMRAAPRLMATAKMSDRSESLIRVLDPNLYDLLRTFKSQEDDSDGETDSQDSDDPDVSDDFTVSEFGEFVDGHFEAFSTIDIEGADTSFVNTLYDIFDFIKVEIFNNIAQNDQLINAIKRAAKFT